MELQKFRAMGSILHHLQINEETKLPPTDLSQAPLRRTANTDSPPPPPPPPKKQRNVLPGSKRDHLFVQLGKHLPPPTPSLLLPPPPHASHESLTPTASTTTAPLIQHGRTHPPLLALPAGRTFALLEASLLPPLLLLLPSNFQVGTATFKLRISPFPCRNGIPTIKRRCRCRGVGLVSGRGS